MLIKGNLAQVAMSDLVVLCLLWLSDAPVQRIAGGHEREAAGGLAHDHSFNRHTTDSALSRLRAHYTNTKRELCDALGKFAGLPSLGHSLAHSLARGWQTATQPRYRDLADGTR